MKRIISLILSAIMFFSFIININLSGFANTNADDSNLKETYWAMTEEEALGFIAFIYDTGKVTEEMKYAGDLFDFLTGKFSKGSLEEHVAKINFLTTAKSNISQCLKNYSVVMDNAYNSLLEYLMKQANGDIDDGLTNHTLNKIGNSYINIIATLGNADENTIKYIEDIKNIYSNISSIKGKVEKLKAGLNSFNYAWASSNQAAYKYISLYINNLSIAEGLPEDVLITLDSYVQLDDSNLAGTLLFYGNDNLVEQVKLYGKYIYYVEKSLENFEVKVNENEIDKYNVTPKFKYKLENSKITITGIEKDTCPINLLIPTTIDNYPVTNINFEYLNNSADYKNIESITIGSNVKNISNYTFSVCSNLNYIMVEPDNETYCSINGVLFTKDKTKIIRFPQNRKSGSYIISNKVTGIGNFAFENCKLYTVVLPESLTTIDPFSFANSGITNINIPINITSIGNSAFSGCYNLESIIIPNNVIYIGDGVFDGCKNLKKVEIGNGIKEIPFRAFNECINLKDVNLSNGLKKIGVSAFCLCSNLESIILPESLETICEYAFSSSGLVSIYIPSAVKEIAYMHPFSCDTLENISVSENNKYFTSVDGIMYSKDKSTLLHYPSGRKNSFYQVESFVKKIDSCAIYSKFLKNIIIPYGVEEINWEAIICENLERITLPNSLNIISNDAIIARNLKNIYYKGSVEEWRTFYFYKSPYAGNYDIENAVIQCENAQIDCKNNIHDYMIGVQESTCLNSGMIYRKCSVCKKNNDAVLEKLGHNFTVYISNNDATYEKDGTKTAVCSRCGEKDTVIDKGSMLIKKPDLSNFIIKTVSLSLESSITMNFKVLKSAVADFENPYVVFNCEGDELTVTDYTEQGDYYVFSYPGISPQLMNDNVVAVLHAEHNGIDYTSPEKVMSVRTYAYTMLDRYNSDNYAKLRTLLVDLLNYGAASQKYIGYQTNNLVNADLTDEQMSWGTNTTPTFENIRNYNYKTINNSTSKWVGSGLVLNNSVMVRAKFTADNIENKTVKITCGKGEFTYSKDDFVKDKDGNYYVYCNEIFANEMSEEILLTVYNNGVQCSNTMRFSIESYAKLVHDNYAGNALDELTTAMMRYGNSAKAYGA